MWVERVKGEPWKVSLSVAGSASSSSAVLSLVTASSSSLTASTTSAVTISIGILLLLLQNRFIVVDRGRNLIFGQVERLHDQVEQISHVLFSQAMLGFIDAEVDFDQSSRAEIDKLQLFGQREVVLSRSFQKRSDRLLRLTTN